MDHPVIEVTPQGEVARRCKEWRDGARRI